MIKTRCTHCNASMDAPETYVGRSAKCRKCGRKFVIREEMPAVEFQAADPEELAEMTGSNSYPMRTPSIAGAATAERSTVGASVAVQHGGTRFDSSEERYPNLLKYLAWGRVLSQVLLVLAIIGAAFVFVTGMYSVYRLAAAELIGLGQTIASLLTTSLGTGLILVGGYAFYVVTMAGIEFMRVVVDIEANTRRRD